MTQAFYAHMNEIKIKKKERLLNSNMRAKFESKEV
jgi:hypothetical protein